MGILSRIGHTVGNVFRRKPPAAPKITRKPILGHRGVAAGNLQNPDLSQENIDQWQNLPRGEAEAFVYDGEPLFVHSTNVSLMQYHIDTNQMMVEYHGGKAYLYSNVSEQEAIGAANASSKGAWCWDTLRIRGTKDGHKKPFTRLK